MCCKLLFVIANVCGGHFLLLNIRVRKCTHNIIYLKSCKTYGEIVPGIECAFEVSVQLLFEKFFSLKNV
jgi:hypothetical protein